MGRNISRTLKMAKSYLEAIQDYASAHPDDANPLIEFIALPERNVTKFFYSNAVSDGQPTTISQLLSLVHRMIEIEGASDKCVVAFLATVMFAHH